MEIRAITGFTTLGGDDAPFVRMAAFLNRLRDGLQAAGIRVQSCRMATQPYPRMGVAPGKLADLARRLRALGAEQGVNYVAIGPSSASDDPAYVDALPEVFAAADGIFAGVAIASKPGGIDLALLRRAARVIQRTSRITPDGLTNLYLAASANVGPGTPFFPAAYHDGGPDSFALAIQAADLATNAFRDAPTPQAARERLTAAISAAAARLVPLAREFEAAHGVQFKGLDFSLAPYPGEETSLARAMESLGVTAGGGGMLAAAALVMNGIEGADFPRCGFSGLMLPVLEDTALGQRAGEGSLTVNDLLLYSAMCGTGLDCIPLPGDVDEPALAGILLDTAALALRLDKPLTARLMPLPGKTAGDPVSFPHFEYFVPSRVMSPPRGLGNAGALAGQAAFTIRAR